MGFTKLFSDILSSSIWNEDKETRLVWITLLALKGGDNIARASVGGLAHQARVTLQECKKAVEKLSGPDPDDRSGRYSGRRIEKVEGGFLILNGQKYIDRRDEDSRRTYMAEYMRDYRKRKPVNVNFVNNGKLPLTQSEEESEKEKTTKTNFTLRDESIKPEVVIVSSLACEFRLSTRQASKVTQYIKDKGDEYVLLKAKIVRSSPRDNAARAFLAALRDDWQPPKKITKPKIVTKPRAAAPEPEVTDEQRSKLVAEAKAESRRFRASLRT